MNAPQCPSFTHVHSDKRTGEHSLTTRREKPENIPIAPLAMDLLVRIDSAWIIGLMRSCEGVDVIGIFSESADPALWEGYVDSICVCARAETPALLDSQLRGPDLARFLVPIETDGQDLAILAMGPRNRHLQYTASDVCVMREYCGRIGNALRARTPS
jgi:hypothetical protein